MSGPVLSSTKAAEFKPPLCWPLLPVPNEDGQIEFPDLETSIRQRIEAVLRTSPGEQLMRPEFGAGLELLLHQPNTAEVRSSAQKTIGEAVRVYEPRVMVDRVEVVSGNDPKELLITIGYRIKATGTAAQISASVPVGGA